MTNVHHNFATCFCTPQFYYKSYGRKNAYLQNIYLPVVAGTPKSVYCVSHDQEIMVRCRAEEKTYATCPQRQDWLCVTCSFLVHGLFGKL